ncbi:MAG: MFS transporter [Chloroflexi bacterium]|nr:MFS transporter [Chloroflexota bacterium]
MIVFVDVLGLGITLPVLPLYAQNEFGASAQDIAGITSLFFFAQMLAAPVLGRLSDAFGRRPLLLASQGGTFIALLVNALAQSMGMIYLARVIDGLTGGNISVAQAYLTDITDERNRASGLGVINAAFGAGFVFGPAFGAFMAAQFGARVPFMIAAGVSLVTIALTYFLLPESHTAEKRRVAAQNAHGAPAMNMGTILRNPAVVLILLIGFTGQFAFFGFQSTFVLWADKIMLKGASTDDAQRIVGGIFTLIGIMNIIAQVWLIRPLVRRFGEKPLIAGGVAIRGLAFGILPALPLLPVVLLTAPLQAIGGSVLQPALIALLTYLLPGRRGQVIGIYSSAGSIGNVIGPLAAGYLFQFVNPSAPMWMSAGVSVITLAFALALWKLTPPVSTPMHPIHGALGGRPAPTGAPAQAAVPAKTVNE